jgi:hypothetical protein
MEDCDTVVSDREAVVETNGLPDLLQSITDM